MMDYPNNSPKKSLRISQRFVSYLEKHRIFELFQELSTMIIIKKPVDHLLFLKQSIHHAAQRLDAPRIIIFAPPGFETTNALTDKLELAHIIMYKFDVPLIKLSNILKPNEAICGVDLNVMIERLRMLLLKCMDSNRAGWIFLDFPRNDKEARYLQRAGIIPSHIIEIVPSEPLSRIENNSSEPNYYQEIYGLRHVYANNITTVYDKGETIEEIAEKCLRLVKRKKYTSLPVTFRILLIDTFDCERGRCLGDHVAKVFKISHINFDKVMEMVSLQDTELGCKVRIARRKEKTSRNLPAELKIEVFKQYLINEVEDLKNGWILTGFPTKVDDFQQLDMIDTPPNRVVIVLSETRNNCETAVPCIICQGVERVCGYVCIYENINDIIKYAGESASILNEHEDLNIMKEKLEICLMQPPPNVPPRTPASATIIKPEDIEYDPDDEPRSNIFDSIREPETPLSLI